MTEVFVPVAEPRVIEGAYSEDQHRRLLDVVRREGPWSLILAQHFKSPEEVVATTSGNLPEGFKPTWDMFLSPVFRGYLAKGMTSLYPEIDDCFLNPSLLNQVRDYWGAKYARAENMLFNIQGPCSGGGAPHVDATNFRGVTLQTTPIWLMNMMVKSNLFEHWRTKKAQVIAWYYKGTTGGGFTYWPQGLAAAPKQIHAPMWGRAVVVENEKMYHGAESCGPAALRKPAGLDIGSVMEADPDSADGWRIRTGEQVIQRIPESEFRFLIHWGADIFMDLDELRVSLDHSDDLTHERIFDILIADLRRRGVPFVMPTDPMTDTAFIQALTQTYDPGLPAIFPAEPEEREAA
ncbi:hypothetical protein M9979_13570 [Sphingomonas sp. RP10(2022)]|uniref:Uncharacterized protein n=1 Tax=Sphingomonas liriopis TaxID=2949094 RepID=A0A9X2HUS7_9SPHN|nr:hypothetical protein [Sphingomonas liriopis]MCP3735899.1 hypothetical protein [Sphingomonas liriopis]